MAKTKEPRFESAAVQQNIVDQIASGLSLREICQQKGMPNIATVMRWVNSDRDFCEHYARAREAQADLIFDDLDEVSERAVQCESAVEVQGLRLKADNIKWKLARMSPKKYGDRMAIDAEVKVNRDLPQVDAQIARLMAKLGPDQTKRG